MTPTTILIVDDEAMGREVLAALLHNQGYLLVFAENGSQALAMATDYNPDLILLDVMMMGMDGFEVCRVMRATAPLADVPIILITALDDRDSRLQGLEAGADDFITKPFDRLELRARVKTITRLNRYRRLIEERSRFNWVVENADDGYVLLNEDDTVRYANPRARLYLNLPSDETLAASDTLLTFAKQQYHCEPQEAWASWPAPLPENSRDTRYLVRPESEQSHALWLAVELLPTPDKSATSRLVRLRDITVQMGLQRDTWAFHAAVFHKLRTPLACIQGSLRLISSYTRRTGDGEIGQVTDIALRGAQRLSDEVEDILQYLRVPERTTPETGCMVGQIPMLVGQLKNDMEIETVQVSGCEPLYDVRLVLAPQIVELLLSEVFENAKKFHPHHTPTIEIAVSRDPGGDVTLHVCDNGLTLGVEQLARIGTPYYQGEKFFTGEVAGMGLGLAMIFARLWNVGGACRVLNRRPGPGIEVALTIPSLA